MMFGFAVSSAKPGEEVQVFVETGARATYTSAEDIPIGSAVALNSNNKAVVVSAREIAHIGDDRIVATSYLPTYDKPNNNNDELYWCGWCHNRTPNDSRGCCKSCNGPRGA